MANSSDLILDFPQAVKENFNKDNKLAIRCLQEFEIQIFSEVGIVVKLTEAYRKKQMREFIKST